MQDRVPFYPGRVKLTPVSGQENTYDMVRADEPTQEGDPLSKATFLKDDTAELFGLDATAVPDEVFGKLSMLYLHNWRRRVNGKVLVEQTGFNNRLIANTVQSNWTSYTFYYSDTVSLSSDGTITLNEPVSSVSITSTDEYEKANVLKGKYYFERSTSGTRVWYVPADAADAEAFVDSSGSRSIFGVTIDRHAYIVTDYIGDWEIVSSTNRNAYPDSGIQDGYEYQYLGVPFENARSGAKIATGSYTGTGTYGESDPNSLTFDFEPKIVFITRLGTGFVGYAGNLQNYDGAVYTKNTNNIQTTSVAAGANGSGSTATFRLNENTLSWFSTIAANAQLNVSGITYDYVAIG